MATIKTRSTGVTALNRPLTVQEFDENLINLKFDLDNKFDKLLSPEVVSSLYTGPNVIKSTFVYDTSNDSDGGDWTDKCGDNSWYSTAITDSVITPKWLGKIVSGTLAKADSITGFGITGDYYQNTTNGNFYQLTADSEIQITRGAKKEFPKLVAIITISSAVLLFDLTEPDYPFFMSIAGTNIINAKMFNGNLLVAETTNVKVINIINETVNTIFTGTINDIDICEISNAEYDVNSNLRIPTIGIATTAGLKIYTNRGVLLNSSDTASFNSVNINYEMIIGSKSNANIWYYASSPNTLSNNFSLNSVTNNFNSGNTANLVSGSRSNLVRSSGALVQSLKNNEEYISNGMGATITNTYNTGYQVGDIRRTYIGETGSGSVGPSTELVTNGTFATNLSSWSVGALVSSSTINGDGTVTLSGNTAAAQFNSVMYQYIPVVSGEAYIFTCPIINNSTSLVSIDFYGLGTGGNGNAARLLSPGTYIFISNSTTTCLHFYAWSNSSLIIPFNATIGPVSVKRLLSDRSYKSLGANIIGALTKTPVNTNADLSYLSNFSDLNYVREPYHADLDFGTGEWTVSAWAKYSNLPTGGNLLLYSEQFNNGVWGGNGRTVVANAVLAPDGTTTADKVVPTAINDTHYIGQSVAVFYSVAICSVYAKAGEKSKITISIGSTIGRGFDLITGTSSAVTGLSGPISYGMTDVGNDWWRCWVVATGGNIARVDVLNTFSSVLHIGNGTDGLYLWGANYSSGDTLLDYVKTENLQSLTYAYMADRSYSSGPKISLLTTNGGHVKAIANDGTTQREVMSPKVYNTNTPVKFRANYTTDGSLALMVNGMEVARTTGSPLLALSTAWKEVAPKLGSESYIYSLAVFNNKLYGGTNPNGKLYEWNGTNAWVEVAPKLGSETYILSLAVFNNKLYGSTASNGKLYEWNGTNAWVEVAPQLGSETYILSLAVFNNKLYGGTLPNGKLYEWNGTNAWIEVAPKLGSETNIQSLAVFNNKLYGGTYPNGKLYEWNGTNAWVEVAPKLGSESYIYSLAVFNNKLYGGTGTTGRLYEWNGTNAWVEVAPKLGSESYIYSLAVFNNKLYGGTNPNGRLYEWNGTNAWVEVAPKLGSETSIYNLAVFNNKLYGGTNPSGKLYEWNGIGTTPVLTMGNNYTLDAPFPGSLALVKFSGTVPTSEQSLYIYEQEKRLFNENAKCLLPDNTTILDVDYDKQTNKFITASTNNVAIFDNLVRVNNYTSTNNTKVSSNSNYKLIARNTSVDIITPKYSLKDEHYKVLNTGSTKLETFNYVGGFSGTTSSTANTITGITNLTYPVSYIGAKITGANIPANTYVVNVSGTTIYMNNNATASGATTITFQDFYLPIGYKARIVTLAGLVKQKGSTKDYTTLYDGFKKKVRFNDTLVVGAVLNPTAQIQIQACQYNNI